MNLLQNIFEFIFNSCFSIFIVVLLYLLILKTLHMLTKTIEIYFHESTKNPVLSLVLYQDGHILIGRCN